MTEQDPDARIAEQSADYVFNNYESVRPRDMFELALLHAALDAVTGVKAAIEARVRAEVAEELAWIFEKRAAQEQGPFERRDPAAVAFVEAARTARSHAGSSPDTTPEPKPKPWILDDSPEARAARAELDERAAWRRATPREDS